MSTKNELWQRLQSIEGRAYAAIDCNLEAATRRLLEEGDTSGARTCYAAAEDIAYVMCGPPIERLYGADQYDMSPWPKFDAWARWMRLAALGAS